MAEPGANGVPAGSCAPAVSLFPGEGASPRAGLRLLLVEDPCRPAEALAAAILARPGCTIELERVGDRVSLVRALHPADYDAIFCEESLPGWSAGDAIRVAAQLAPDIPVLLISQRFSAEAVSEAAALGAADCIFEQHLARVPLALNRVLREKGQRARWERAEDALGESELQYRLLFECHPQPMWVYDLETLGILAVNDAAVERYGYSRDEFLGMSLRDLRPGTPRPPEETAEAGHGPEAAAYKTHAHRLKDGSQIEVEITTHTLVFNDRAAELVMAVDVTERRQLEAQLQDAQRMESVGHLAGGIAHEFNNVLMVVRGFAELLEDRLVGRAELHYVEKILQAIDRAARVVAQLLAYGRKQVLQPRVLDLNDCLADVARLLPRVLGEHISIAVEPATGLRRVCADPVQIEHALIALAIHARDLMPQGGKLIIESANAAIDATAARRHGGARPGDYAMIAVTDTGLGLDHEARRHLFEPFRRNDPADQNGMSLSAAYGIVQQSGGFITVSSQLGKGETFRLYFPAVRGAARTTAPAAEGALGGSETVLVVEDEEGVREAMTEFLRARGYHVLAAGSGAEALEAMAQHAGHLDLLLTDVIMPGMSGRELATRVGELRPATRVLYISGYTGEIIAQHGVLEPGMAFLEKPFSWDTLLAKVREVLEGRAEKATPPRAAAARVQ